MAEGVLPHLRIHSRCGACGGSMHLEDRIFLLGGASVNKSGHGAANKHKPVVCPDAPAPSSFWGDASPCGRYTLCPRPGCAECQQPTLSAHAECAMVFLRFVNSNRSIASGVSLLWHAAEARYPWPGSACPLVFPFFEGPEVAVDLAEAFPDFPQLARMPPEICALILGDRSLRSPTLRLRFRLLETKAVARRLLASSGDGVPTEAPLSRIQSWERDGSEPAHLQNEDSSRPVIATIDAAGIKALGREPPPARPGAYLFAVIEAGVAAEAKATFKHGVCQLSPPKPGERRTFWNTPTPPDNIPPDAPFYPQLSLFIPAQCRGITLLDTRFALRGVHVHTDAEPTAESTYSMVPAQLRHSVTWVHIPLAPPIESLQSFTAQQVFLKDMLDRNVAIPGIYDYKITTSNNATFDPGCHRHMHLAEPDPHPSIYAADKDAGFVCAAPHDEHGHVTGPLLSLGSILSPAPSLPCYAGPWHAHLDPSNEFTSIVRTISTAVKVTVYRIPGTRFCRGMIFHDADGTARALGSCRVGVDDATTYNDLGQLYFRRCWGDDRWHCEVELRVEVERRRREDSEPLSFTDSEFYAAHADELRAEEQSDLFLYPEIDNLYHHGLFWEFNWDKLYNVGCEYAPAEGTMELVMRMSNKGTSIRWEPHWANSTPVPAADGGVA